MKILFKYATRSRPQHFIRGLKSILNNLSSDDYEVIITVDKDDKSMEWSLIKDECLEINDHRVKMCWGESANKIHAINKDIEQCKDWDILVNMSDDMVFNVKGFDNVIRDYFPTKGKVAFGSNSVDWHDLDTCLHFPDGNRKDLITMSIMGRDYYNRFNYIYHPDYVSLYCDNEQTEVAKMLGCYKYVDKQIFEHLHPAYGKAVFDAQYQHTESFNEVDRQTYLRRKEMNFGL